MKRNMTLLIIILIILTIIFPCCFTKEDNGNRKIDTNDFGKLYGDLYLEFDNKSQMYYGIIGPICDKNGTPINDVTVTLIIQGIEYSNKTNLTGFVGLYIPQNIIEKIDFDQRYTIKASKDGFNDTSWEFYIIINK